ncbi:hypothetical protein [Flavisphingomonas formosensis]|uniref:hypothetical protein n=1 Tax=Flavisphingomonas formosensis TaxID=861534 RepID=UPI0012FB2D21|nr:hypothetical protein [Sphingomonas formosensis]
MKTAYVLTALNVYAFAAGPRSLIMKTAASPVHLAVAPAKLDPAPPRGLKAIISTSGSSGH